MWNSASNCVTDIQTFCSRNNRAANLISVGLNFVNEEHNSYTFLINFRVLQFLDAIRYSNYYTSSHSNLSREILFWYLTGYLYLYWEGTAAHSFSTHAAQTSTSIWFGSLFGNRVVAIPARWHSPMTGVERRIC